MFLSFACFYSFSQSNSPLFSVFELSVEKTAFRMIVLSRKAIIVLSLKHLYAGIDSFAKPSLIRIAVCWQEISEINSCTLAHLVTL